MPEDLSDFEDAGFKVLEQTNANGDHEKLSLQLDENLAIHLGVQSATGQPLAGWTRHEITTGGQTRFVVTNSWKKDPSSGAVTAAAAGDTCPIDQ